jgi:hypothetical protein
MTTHLRLLYVCDRQFAELPGDDPKIRRCDTCATPVHNLDAMPGDDQLELLRHAIDEKTTVCVSLALPPELARACRAGEAVAPQPAVVSPLPLSDEHFVPLAGVAVRVEPLAGIAMHVDEPPPIAASSHRWRRLPADPPTVIAAITGLAGAFDLRALAEHRWHFHGVDPPVRGEVVVEADGAGARVGLAVEPEYVAADARSATLAVVALITVPMWLVGVVGLWLAGLVSGPGVVVPLVCAAALVGLGLAIHALREAWRLRHVRRWSRELRRRFWPALADRVAPGRVYR